MEAIIHTFMGLCLLRHKEMGIHSSLLTFFFFTYPLIHGELYLNALDYQTYSLLVKQ